MNKRAVQLIVVAAAIVIFAAVAYFGRTPASPQASLDEFAQCLSEKGAVMYGAYWCQHCQNQKAMFGDSFRFISDVECTEEPQTCTDAGIRAFPTWIFPDSPAGRPGGLKLVGTQTLETLAQVSACPLPVGE